MGDGGKNMIGWPYWGGLVLNIAALSQIEAVRLARVMWGVEFDAGYFGRPRIRMDGRAWKVRSSCARNPSQPRGIVEV